MPLPKLEPPPRRDDERFDDWVIRLYQRLVALEAGSGDSSGQLTPGQVSSLTGGASSGLHFHGSDRNRSNHFGSQPVDSIDGFESAVLALTALSNSHPGLNGLGWLVSGHTGTAGSIPAWTTGGVASEIALASGIATWLATPSSANLRSALTDETGSGSAVFATSPTLVTPLLGTPTSGTLTNCTGLPISTGVSGLGANVAAFLATPSSANLRSALTDESGTGAAYFQGGDLGTPSAGVLTNASGLPLTTGVTGTLAVTNGGTGRATSTTAYGLLAAGTTATGAHQTLAAGATTEILVGGGASALPVWTPATGSGAPVRATSPTLVTPVLGAATATSITSTDYLVTGGGGLYGMSIKNVGGYDSTILIYANAGYGGAAVSLGSNNAGTFTNRLTVLPDGRVFGTALHNNAGAVTGATNQYIASGTYTPTLTGVANVDSTTARQCQWMRVGNVVTVSGSASIDTTAATTTALGVSLPIASNLANTFNLAGNCGGVNNPSGVIYGDVTNDRAELSYLAAGASAEEVSFLFQYLVI